MSALKREITRNDILSMEEYGRIRREKRRELASVKRRRRLAVGPFMTAYFECYDTMWQQVHEMLYTERGGEEQVADELSAYNPLIPKGRELVATVMIEIPDETVRRRTLATLGHIEDTITLRFGGEEVAGVPEDDLDRTTPDGKTSSVHFIHFPFTDAQVEKFREPGTEVVFSVGHANYRHMAVMPEDMRAELAKDFA